jgi:hypothetical protein
MFIFIAPDILFVDWPLFPRHEPQQHTLICINNRKVVLEHILLQHVSQIRHLDIHPDTHLLDWIQGYIQGQVDLLSPVSGVLNWVSKNLPHAQSTHWLITNQLRYTNTTHVHVKRPPTMKVSVPPTPPSTSAVYLSEEEEEAETTD